MTELPSGTVSLLFSDIEGSTVLLSRLGPEYGDALADHRQVLRKAWAGHEGVEMGTEGDSFFVVFSSATAAVTAAAQAQRELAGYEWPGGERLRVRMGIHTGSPVVRDGEYVGMDVHRAARVARAAHGGQVVISAETAGLAEESLPEGVHLMFLGPHRLKDLQNPERLFQLTVDGLQDEFPPLKAIGAASSLPEPGTPLVGRDGELAELDAALASSDVRLATLTGPGGTGKTRLAIALAQRLIRCFPDGVYFVPLETVTTPEVMWTSIADVLELPPEERVPPALFTQLADRAALYVLDNLEQLVGADTVVAELLSEAPRSVVVATSRSPLHLPAEHEHAVPPLELPETEELDAVIRSGAVQLFVLKARKGRSGFTVTADNATDVAAVCRRLDGLPLAVELAAARTKLLSPRALLSRLDTALDIPASGGLPRSRQKTLRDTISWSHNLLTQDQQNFFRRFGVFSGGADLDAVTAVILANEPHPADLLDRIADLVDASLLTVSETADGEPRFAMLQTIRSYAHDLLIGTGELNQLHERHAQHYLALGEQLKPHVHGPRSLEIRARYETEHDNYREALAWALGSADDSIPGAPNAVRLGLRLCAALDPFWRLNGHFSEGKRWFLTAVERTGKDEGPELARCLALLANHMWHSADLDRAHECMVASVEMWRRIDDPNGLSEALRSLGATESRRGEPDAARQAYGEALAIARRSGDKQLLRPAIGGLAYLENSQHNHERSLDLLGEALDLARELNDTTNALFIQHNMACALRQMGRATEAQARMRDLIPKSLELNQPADLVWVAEDYAAILADVGDHILAVELLAAADQLRERISFPRDPVQEAEIAEPIASTHRFLSIGAWDDAYRRGRTTAIADLLTVGRSEGSGPSKDDTSVSSP